MSVNLPGISSWVVRSLGRVLHGQKNAVSNAPNDSFLRQSDFSCERHWMRVSVPTTITWRVCRQECSTLLLPRRRKVQRIE